MSIKNVARGRTGWWEWAATAGVLLFFAPMLSVPRSYGAGAAILLLAGLAHLARKPFAGLSREDKAILTLMVGMFGVGAFSYFFHGNARSDLDLASRYLLAVPVFLLLIKHAVDPRWVWAATAIGACSAAGVALWDTTVLGLDRATGMTGGIQFGNLGLMMGVFSLAGAIEAGRAAPQPGRGYWRVLFAAGALAGLYVSIASGSRGGWVALPLIGMVFIVAYAKRSNLKYVAAAAVLLAAAALAALITVPAVENRYDEALSDIQQYEKGNPYTSLGQRMAMYEALYIAIPQKPWLGWNRADLRKELERQARDGEGSDAALILANTHNTFLEVWVYQGLLGLAALLALMAVALRYFLRRLWAEAHGARAGAVCGASLVVGYAVFSLTQVMLARNNTLLFFLVSMAVFWAMAKPSASRIRYTAS